VEVSEEIENLGAHGNIQSAYRLIGDDKVRLKDQGAADTDTLFLAPGQFINPPPFVGRIQPHQFKDFVNPPVPFGSGTGPVNHQGFFKEKTGGLGGVKGTIGILEHRLYIPRRFPQAAPAALFAADSDCSLVVQESQDTVSQGSFPGTGFAYKSENFAPAYLKIDVFEDRYPPFPAKETKGRYLVSIRDPAYLKKQIRV
jgi:hypothetical protein